MPREAVDDFAERSIGARPLRKPRDVGTHRGQGLPELVVEGLPDGDARTLLASALTTPLDPSVREVIPVSRIEQHELPARGAITSATAEKVSLFIQAELARQ